ncbi:patatin-like phospholipase family protein [Allofournierella sp.]|uniref:patatin-like phospholipase family protein n=2 Tax=Allofournierella sp. TaxID=1940256 RepID=UPI003AB2025E
MEQDTTLLLEGGAMRGLYTSGVLDVFMEHGLYLPNVVGVSAGALNGVNYVARQPGRSLRANLDFLDDPRYMGPAHLLKEFSFFNFDFLLGEMAESLLPFDFDTFWASGQRLWAVAADCRTGRALFYEKHALGPDFFTAVRASASMPLLGSMVKVGRDVCLDGGVANCIPIPADLPFPAGKTVLVLTRQQGFRKPPQSRPVQRLYHRRYGAYPALLAACLAQPEVYNAQMERIDRLEAEGRVFVIRPSTPVTVGRTERDKAKLRALYDQGRAEAEACLPALGAYLGL